MQHLKGRMTVTFGLEVSSFSPGTAENGFSSRTDPGLDLETEALGTVLFIHTNFLLSSPSPSPSCSLIPSLPLTHAHTHTHTCPSLSGTNKEKCQHFTTSERGNSSGPSVFMEVSQTLSHGDSEGTWEVVTSHLSGGEICAPRVTELLCI